MLNMYNVFEKSSNIVKMTMFGSEEKMFGSEENHEKTNFSLVSALPKMHVNEAVIGYVVAPDVLDMDGK